MNKNNSLTCRNSLSVECFILDAHLVDNLLLAQIPKVINIDYKIDEQWISSNVLKKSSDISYLLKNKLELLFKNNSNFSFNVDLMRPTMSGNKQRIFTSLFDIAVKDSLTDTKHIIHSSVTFKT